MSDVASLLLEIETAQKESVISSSSQLLGSLFDKDDDENENEDVNTNNCDHATVSLCITGKLCTLHSTQSTKNDDDDLIPIEAIKTARVLTDRHDARHHLSQFDMKEIISTQQRLQLNKSINAKQWQEDKEWHLRNEKLLLMKENSECSIDELQHERYGDLHTNTKSHKPKTDDSVIGYTLPYTVPSHLVRPKTKLEHELMDKVAKWAIDRGIQFESMIKIKQTHNPKFAFFKSVECLSFVLQFPQTTHQKSTFICTQTREASRGC
eukprot:313447_1